YQRAIRSGVKNDTIILNYVYALKANGHYEEARNQITNFLNVAKSDYIIKRANEIADGLDQLETIKETTNYYRVKNLSAINTRNTEYSPVYGDGYLYFTSNRDNTKVYKGTGLPYTNIYRVQTKGAIADTATIEALSEAINTFNINEGTLTFTPDGKTMVFARGNQTKRKSRSNGDLYISRQRNGEWTAPQLLGTAVNNPDTWESTPAFSRDGRTLYFSSDRPGGYGNVDIYSARMSNRGRFSEAKNLGPEINTSGNDMFPYVSDDGHLYLASDGHPGFGGLDLFVVKRQDGVVTVSNLGKPMNSTFDDFAIFFFKADRGFFSSNREGGEGDDDIYTFLNEDPNLKIINYYLKGITMTKDKDDKLVILPNVNVKILDYNDQILDEVETGQNGEFLFRVYEHEHYTLLGERSSGKESYLTTRLDYNTVGRAVDRDTLKDLTTNVTFDTLLVLEKKEINKVFVLDNIYYDLDSWDIRQDAAVELDKLVVLLQDNPEIKIELSSHTDSRQTDSYNLRLSQRRAKSAVDYIVSQGIEPQRLVAKGYGESNPFTITDTSGNRVILTESFINSNDEIDERERLHQLNRRTEFKILEINTNADSFNEERYFDDKEFRNDNN
ncbi:MAG: OmpA family protein, partial [Cyclobacteriaceae bacterium]|nr:OmpA family protein [Cyclobacteriaceae bacterium]